MDSSSLLELKGLVTAFRTDDGTVRAIDDVSFSVAPGRTLALVGESGCGKSVTALSIMGLLPQDTGFVESGEVRFEGENLLDCSAAQMRAVRGNRISMIFQEPMTALNPVFTAGEQIAEVFRVHRGLSRREARNAALAMLESVRIPDPARRLGEYPFQMSGGMRQRVMIAMALACEPRLLIADEPTTALDVTIQAQILRLMKNLQAEHGTAILLITHDLGVVAETADDVAIMYAGRIVETAGVEQIFGSPQHPYTQGLLASLPSLESRRDVPLATIEGTVPALRDLPTGCRFHTRCPHAAELCRAEDPQLADLPGGGRAACVLVAGRLPG